MAIEDGRWADALASIDADPDAAGSPELLELRAQAAYGNGDLEASIGAWEAQHAVLRAAGDDPGAARAAAMVAMFLMIDTGLMAPVRGWLRRAEHLLEEHGETPVHAVVAAVRTYERFMCGDMEAARRQSDLAISLGQRLDAPAAEVIGRTAAARITILEGRVGQGLEQLDEVGVVLMAGDVDPLTTGMMLCELVCAAQGLGLYDMACEWTEAMDRWRHGAAFGGLHGRCRVHRAEILRVSGPAAAAEDEALHACDDLRPWMRREFGWPLAELGNIRLRRGDLAGAEEAYRAAHEHVWCPHPGLALVRLAQGRLDEAAALILESIEHPFRAPSKERPPFGDLVLAPLLEAQVEIASARGDLAVARRASEALRTIARTYETRWLIASADLAEARAHLLADAWDDAVERSAAAAFAWAEMGAPYEAATARSVLGEAHALAGRSGSARLEWEAAASSFAAFGAEWRAARVRERLAAATVPDAPPTGGPLPASASRGAATGGAEVRRAPARAPAVLDEPGAPAGPAARATFRLDGEVRVVSFAGQAATMRDLKGFGYLARLLADPGRELHVLDLVAVQQGTLPTGTVRSGGHPHADGFGAAGSGLAVLDEQARAAYKRRLADVEEDIDDAHRCNDPARAELAERDRDYLIAELAHAVGLGGRLRSVGSDSERARTAVARALRYAIARLDEQVPALAAHLRNCLHTGTYCTYTPDPTAPITWTL